MNVIDRYIGKRFFINFLSILFSFILVFTLIHWVDHSGKYKGADLQSILTFYLNYIPQVINLVIPVCGLLSGLITFSNLGKYNELIALQVSGISRRRYISVALIISFLVSVSLFFFNELVLIDANNKRDFIEDVELLKKTPPKKGVRTNVLLNSINGTIIQIGKVDIDNGLLTNFNIQYHSDSLQSITKRIDSDSVFWEDSSKWVLKHVKIREILNDSIYKEVYQDSLIIAETIFTPKDFIKPRFKPDRVDKFLYLSELIDIADKRKLFGQMTYQIDYEIYNTFFAPLSIFFMAFIGSILGSMFTKGSAILYFIGCIIICLLYMVVVIMGKVMSQDNTLTPFIGASLPHIVTLIALVFLSNRKA